MLKGFMLIVFFAIGFATWILKNKISEMNVEINAIIEEMKNDEWKFLKNCREFALLGYKKPVLQKETVSSVEKNKGTEPKKREINTEQGVKNKKISETLGFEKNTKPVADGVSYKDKRNTNPNRRNFEKKSFSNSSEDNTNQNRKNVAQNNSVEELKSKTAGFVSKWIQRGLREGAIVDVSGMGKFELLEEKREVVNPYTQENTEVVASRKFSFFSDVRIKNQDREV